MNETRKFINDLRNVGPVVGKKIDHYWTEVEKKRGEDLIEPTIGVDENGEVLFSWELGDYYFEVEFRVSAAIEGFWESGDVDEQNQYGGTKLSGPEEAAEWTAQQLSNVQ